MCVKKYHRIHARHGPPQPPSLITPVTALKKKGDSIKRYCPLHGNDRRAVIARKSDIEDPSHHEAMQKGQSMFFFAVHPISTKSRANGSCRGPDGHRRTAPESPAEDLRATGFPEPACNLPAPCPPPARTRQPQPPYPDS